ncbi:MAG: hypothetical protein ACLRSD_06975 [Oscillibacter sp.]
MDTQFLDKDGRFFAGGGARAGHPHLCCGLVYSYGGMGRDFYTSNLCLNAVGKKTWEICDDYIAMEGGNYELDKIYSKETATATFASV